MARSRGAGPDRSGPTSTPRGKRGFSRLGREQAAAMASRHPLFVQRLARRHTIQPPTLLALGRSPARRGVPLLSPITPLARRVWEDLLARYATQTAGIDTVGGTLAANRELLSSLSLLASLRQRTHQAAGVQAAASASADLSMTADLPLANAAVPGLTASAAMSATLAPVQRAIAQAMGSTLEAGPAAGMMTPPTQMPGLTAGRTHRKTAGRAKLLPTVGAISLGTGSDALADEPLPPEYAAPPQPRSLVGGPGSLLAAAMPFHALGAAQRQLDASRRQAPADWAETASYSREAGDALGTALPLHAGEPPSNAVGSAVSPIAGGTSSTTPGSVMPSMVGETPGSALGLAMPLSALGAAHRQVAVSRRRTAPDLGVTPSTDGMSARLSLGTLSTPDRSADPAAAHVQSSPRHAALRQIAGSAGQPLAPVVRRMMEMALGATFADVRVHTGAIAGGAAQALGAQAFTMGRDIYFAPGKFEPGIAGGIGLLAHELTHTRQGAAVPLRKAAPGAPAVEAGELEPEHLEAEARGAEAAVLRAFSAPPALPVLSRMVAGSYNALFDEGVSGAGDAWSPFAPRPALSSGGGANAALVDGLSAAWTARAGRAGGAAPVQRQVAAPAPSGGGSIVSAGTAASAPMTSQAAASVSQAGEVIFPSDLGSGMTPHAAPNVSASDSASSTGLAGGTPVQRRGRRQVAGESAPADTGNASAAPASSVGSGAVSAGAGTAYLGNAAAGPASTLSRATITPVMPLQRFAATRSQSGQEHGWRSEGAATALQRFAATGTLLGDLARRRDAHVSPGAVPLSSIFTPGSEGVRTSIQRRAAAGAGGSLTFGAGAAGLSALAGGAAFRIAGSALPAVSGNASPPSVGVPAAVSGVTTPPSVGAPVVSGVTVSPSVQRTVTTEGASTASPVTGAPFESGSSSPVRTGADAEAASRGSGASRTAGSWPTLPPSAGGAWAAHSASTGSIGQEAAFAADYDTIPILQRLTASSFQAPAMPPSSDAFAVPLLARMSMSEYGALSGTADTVGDGWAGLGPLSLGGQGAGWAGAAGGMFHQVQRMAGRQSGPGGSAGSPAASLGGGLTVTQQSAGSSMGVLGGTPGGPFDAPKAPGATSDFALSPAAADVQRAGHRQDPGVLTVESGLSPAAAAVQRTRAYRAGTSTGMMSLSGQGHGLAAMSGGLTARALGTAAIQRAAATAYAPHGTATTSSFGSGFSLPTVPGIGAGASPFGSTPVLQRFAAGASGSVALGAALLGRMSGTDESGWTPPSGAALAGTSGGLSGVAGGVVSHLQRMVGSVPSGASGRHYGTLNFAGIQRMVGPVSSGAGSTIEPAAGAMSALGSAPTTAPEAGVAPDSTSMLGAAAYTALPTAQRMDSATWMGSSTQALAGQTHGFAAMTGGLTARALQAAGAGFASPVQRLGAAQGRTSFEGPGMGWSAALPLQRQSVGAGGFTQRFATSAAIGQAAAGAAQRLAATPVLLGGGRPHSGELAGGPPAVMVSRMWSGRPMGGAMTDDEAPGAATPTGSPVPGLTEMTQRSQGTSAMLVFNGLTSEETGAPRTSAAGAAALPVSRAVAMPPSMPAPASSSGPVIVQRAAASLAPPSNGATTLAGRGMVVTAPVQRAVTVDEVSTTDANTSTNSTDSSSANPGTDLPKDMETLIDTVIKRLKRQLTLDHERAGGFHTSLLR